MTKRTVDLMRIQSSSSEKCCFCSKRCWNISSLHQWIIDYTQDSNWQQGDLRCEYACLTCGNQIKDQASKEDNEKTKENKKQRELSLKQKVNDYFNELQKTRSSLEEKVKNEYLSVADCKKIFTLKSKIQQILKENIKNYQTYWNAKWDFDLLKESSNSLDEFINEFASPQIQEQAKNASRIRVNQPKCRHNNIEQDEEGSYYCAYCWDDNSEEFLKVLERKGLKQGESNNPNPNKDQSRERERESKFSQILII